MEQIPNDENKAEKSPLKLEVSAESRKNEIGKEMQDDYYLNKEKLFFAVADGFGRTTNKHGQTRGSVASESALVGIHQSLKDLPDPKNKDEAHKQMEKIMLAAHDEVSDNRAGEAYRAGSTLTMAKFWEHEGKRMMTFANVGDSRIYLVRNGKAQCLSLDDGVVARNALKKGDKDFAKKQQDIVSNATSLNDFDGDIDLELHYKNQKLTSALGDFTINVTNRAQTIEVMENDTVLLLSDGITDNFTNEEIANLVNSEKETGKIRTKLLEQSAKNQSDKSRFRRKRYQDDLAAVVIRVAA